MMAWLRRRLRPTKPDTRGAVAYFGREEAAARREHDRLRRAMVGGGPFDQIVMPESKPAPLRPEGPR